MYLQPQTEFIAEKAGLSARLNVHKWSKLSRNSPDHIFQKERGQIKQCNCICECKAGFK